MRKKKVSSISIDKPLLDVLKKHAKKKHMSLSGWLAVAAEEKLERDAPDDAKKKKP